MGIPIYCKIEFWALLIAVVSLLVTVITTVAQSKINKQQKVINENLINAEKQALLTTRVIKLERNWKIIITNIGKGKATDIEVTYNDEKAKNNGIHVVANESTVTFPILNYGDSFEMVIFTEEWHTGRLPIEITWNDLKINNSKNQELELSDF